MKNNRGITPPKDDNYLNTFTDLFKGSKEQFQTRLLDGCANVDFSRPLSWDLCYGSFYQNRKHFLDSTPSPTDLDGGALELSSYLASFGMYQNAVLHTLNRRLFSAILKILFEAARNAHIDPYTSKGILSIHQLRVLIEAVKDSYQTFLCTSGYPKSSHPSVTLISKILMGVMGVLPAFDICFKSAIQVFNTKVPENCRLSNKLDDATLTSLLNVAQDTNVLSYIKTQFDGVNEVSDKDENEHVTQQLVPYPPMRLLDLIFWAYGLKK